MKIWKWIRPDSLIKKCIYAMAAVALAMLLLIRMLTQESMFQLLKPELQNNFSVLTSAVSTKISYILHQNSQYLLRFWNDKTLLGNTSEYLSICEKGMEESDRALWLREEILRKLVNEERGETQPGAIISSRKVFLVADGTQAFAREELEPYARLVMESEWFSHLPGIFEALSFEAEEEEGLERCYSPVFPETESTEEFISFAVPAELDGHSFYFIMIESFSDFGRIFSDFEQADLKDYCLLGYGNQILFQNLEDSCIGMLTEEERTSLPDTDQYRTKTTEIAPYTILTARASYRMDQIHVAVALKHEDFLQPYQPFIRTVSLLFSASVIIMAVFILFVLRRSLNPLKELSVQMEAVQDGTYQPDKRIQVEDEVGRVADSFYNMMAQIRKNMERIEKQEKKEKRIEYSLLLSQIDPHFIYNTLNTITYLAKLNRTSDILVLNRALIDMLRDRLRMSQLQIFDRLELEKAQLDSYMTIQGYLCSNKIQYTFEIPDTCRELLYPKNILQPFVENAILHGILLNKDGNGDLIPGIIRISITRENDEIVTEIEDNGIGMAGEQLAHYFEEPPETQMDRFEMSRDSHDHIGIYNIRMRLNYLYGDTFRLETGQSELGGLKIRLIFPVRSSQE